MTTIRAIILIMGASAAAGCPGTLEDRASYGDDDSASYEADDDDDDDDAMGDAASGERRDAAGGWDAAAPSWQSDASEATASWGDAARPGWGDAAASWGDAALADAGRGEAGVAQGGAEAGASCDFRALMQARCGNASCHGGATAATGLDLTSAGLADRVRGERASGACGQYLLVDPEKPEESALYLKVTGQACGVRMPVGGTLSNSEQQCILQWIERL